MVRRSKPAASPLQADSAVEFARSPTTAMNRRVDEMGLDIYLTG